jgi:hypothetical protein
METMTREELFELVWTTPMSKLAVRFGVSDVALAKTCARYNIPRPGRGYWQQISAGTKPRRPRLPWSEVQGPVVADWGLAPAEPPVVAVPDMLTEPHEAVRWLQGELASAGRDEHGRLLVGSARGPSFCVSFGQVSRMLRVLDALAKALLQRGHEVFVGKRHEWSSPEFLVRPHGCVFVLEVEEILASKLDEPTPGERRRRTKLADENVAMQRLVPSGKLRLEFGYRVHGYRGRKAWTDNGPRRLEEVLGHVVIAIEKAAHMERVERDEADRLEEEREAEERRRQRPERLRWYAEWLSTDLEQMLDEWNRACRIREFLDEYNRRLPETARTPMVGRWVQVVQGLAEQLDPMNRVIEIAKELEPSDEVLARLVELEEPS